MIIIITLISLSLITSFPVVYNFLPAGLKPKSSSPAEEGDDMNGGGGGGGDDDMDCIVCLSRVCAGESYRILPKCRHGFHGECIDGWLKEQLNCPLCRTPVSHPVRRHYYHGVILTRPHIFLFDFIVSRSLPVLQWLCARLTDSVSHDLASNLAQSCTYL